MRKKAFERLLREAIILEAEEQGEKLILSAEPIPEAAQARFDAALNGSTEKRQAAVSGEPVRSEKPRRSWIGYGIAAVSAAAVVLAVALMIGITAGTKSTPGQMDAQATSAPQPGAHSAPEPV